MIFKASKNIELEKITDSPQKMKLSVKKTFILILNLLTNGKPLVSKYSEGSYTN